MPYRGYNFINSYSHGHAADNHSYHCGHCNRDVLGHIVASYDTTEGVNKWLLCTSCGNGSVLTKDNILYPSSLVGKNLEGLPSDTATAYLEARRCFSINAYTACELICRKILMHVAVEKQAEEGKSFEYYVDHLASLGYVTTPMKPWVDLIRAHGNKSTHKLEAPDPKRAESTLLLTSLFLEIIYEVEQRASKYTTP